MASSLRWTVQPEALEVVIAAPYHPGDPEALRPSHDTQPEGRRLPGLPSPAGAAGWAALAAMVLLLLSIAGYAVQARQSMTERSREAALSATDLLAEHSARVLDTASFVIRETRARLWGEDWDDIVTLPTWRRLNALEQEFPFIESLWLHDAHGTVRLTSSDWPTPHGQSADRDFFRIMQPARSGPYVSSLFLGRVTGTHKFMLTRRLDLGPAGAGQGFDGIISAAIDPASFAGVVGKFSLPPQTSFVLFREAGDLLARDPDPVRQTGLTITPSLAEGVAEHPSGGMLETEDTITAFRRLDPWPVYVAVEVNRAALHAAWLERVTPYLVLGGLAAVALGGLSIFAYRAARISDRRLSRSEAAADERIEELEDTIHALRTDLARARRSREPTGRR